MLGLLVTLAAATGLAADDYPIYVYPCPQAEGTLKIDGLLDEPDWQKAPVVSGFTRYDKPELMRVQTSVRFLYDRRSLYVAVQCDEPLRAKLTPIASPRDAHAIFSQEAIEVFIDPRHDHKNYYQFAANAAGSLWDSKGGNTAWNSTAQVATHLDADSWTVEFAFPWKDYDLKPRSGMVVGLNVCRDRLIGGNREWSNWSQTKANFHDPERFGHLVLSPTAEQIAALGDEFRKGDRSGPLRIFSAEGFSNTSYRALAQASLKKLQAMIADLEATRNKERSAQTRAEIEKRLQAFRRETSQFRAQLESGKPLDGATFVKMDLRIHELTKSLGNIIWEARLSALLSDI